MHITHCYLLDGQVWPTCATHEFCLPEAAWKDHIKFTVAGISLSQSYFKSWIRELLDFVGITRETVASKHLIWMVLSFSRTSQVVPKPEQGTVHELRFRTLHSCKYIQRNQFVFPSIEQQWAPIKTGRKLEKLLKPAICFDILSTERDGYDRHEKRHVSISDRDQILLNCT